MVREAGWKFNKILKRDISNSPELEVGTIFSHEATRLGCGSVSGYGFKRSKRPFASLSNFASDNEAPSSEPTK